MFKIKSVLVSIIVTLILTFATRLRADTIKIVLWWDKYAKTAMLYRSTPPNSLQYQDVNNDAVYNDSIVWYDFSLTVPLNPKPPGGPDDPQGWQYRIDRPSAQFFGGMVGRYAIKETNKKIPLFRRFAQASVQPAENTRPCSYSTKYPNNIGRSWQCSDRLAESCWGDMTLALSDAGWSPTGIAFQNNKEAELNFAAVFIWNKADFLNGGATAETITFDQTSKFSVDLARWRANVSEARFVVQDGNDTLWISEAVAVPDEEKKPFQIAQEGITVKQFERGVTVELNPLNSRWAVYMDLSSLPSADDTAQLLEEIQAINFDPKKASAVDKQQLYYEKSAQVLVGVNKMEFKQEDATFVNHTFADVQAVGVYFGTNQFSHAVPTFLAFDNFLVYATGDVPKQEAVVVDSQGEFQNTQTRFTGGTSVNGAPLEQTVRHCLCDQITVEGNVTVAPEDVGKLANLVVYASYKTLPEDTEESFYMLDKNSNVLVWDKKPENLVAFKENITLLAEQPVTLYTGQLGLTGFLQVFFGYRLPEGTLVTNATPLEIKTNEVNTDSKNEIPYCESIKLPLPTLPIEDHKQ